MKRIGKIRSKKILSLLLILVMAAAVLPSDLLTVTEEAFAVQNDDEVKVDGGVKLGGYGSTSFYYDCDTKTVCNTAPESGSYSHFIPEAAALTCWSCATTPAALLSTTAATRMIGRST